MKQIYEQKILGPINMHRISFVWRRFIKNLMFTKFSVEPVLIIVIPRAFLIFPWQNSFYVCPISNSTQVIFSWSMTIIFSIDYPYIHYLSKKLRPFIFNPNSEQSLFDPQLFSKRFFATYVVIFRKFPYGS